MNLFLNLLKLLYYLDCLNFVNLDYFHLYFLIHLKYNLEMFYIYLTLTSFITMTIIKAG